MNKFINKLVVKDLQTNGKVCRNILIIMGILVIILGLIIMEMNCL